MPDEENVHVVKQFFADFGRGAIPAIINSLTLDVEFQIPGPKDILWWVGTYYERDEVEKFFTLLDGALEFEEFEPQEFFAQGDRVVVIGRERALAKSTGRSYENDWAMVFTVRFGQIASLRVFEDTTPHCAGDSQ